MEPAMWRTLVAVGFLIGQGLLVYTFFETQKMTRQVEMIRLAKDLSSDFYVDKGPYRAIRNSIESCKPLYRSWGGSHSHDEINRYLGFFEDVGFYQKKGWLDLDIIGHLYGAYIIEAYEYPELKKYIALLRKNSAQPTAFEQFERMAKELKNDETFVQLSARAPSMCPDKSVEANQN